MLEMAAAEEPILAAIRKAALAAMYADLGRSDEAAAILEELSPLVRRLPSVQFGGGVAALAWLAEVVDALQDEERAALLRTELEPVRGRFVVPGMPPIMICAPADYYLGLLALTTGDSEEAAARLDDAIRLASSAGMLPVLARARYQRARAHAAIGERPEALRLATAARDDAVRLGMPPLAEDAAALVAALGGAPVGNAVPISGTTTWMFTDIESSTETAARVGDRAWAETLARHNATVRSTVASHGGREVKHLGDGFMLAFPLAQRAVECAIALQRALDGGDLRIRVGVHTGEAEAMDGDYFGSHVNLAARIAGAAAGGEVLVSALTREIVATTGADVAFAEPRTLTLKGVAAPVVAYPLA